MASDHDRNGPPVGGQPNRGSSPSDDKNSSDTRRLVPVEVPPPGTLLAVKSFAPSDPAEELALATSPISGARPEAASGGALSRSVQRRWRLALAVGLLLGSAAATAAWFLRPANYTAIALVRVASERVELLPRDHPVNDQELYRQTQAALLKSPKVLEAALGQAEVRTLPLLAGQADAQTWLEKALLVEPIHNTELLRISLSGQRPADLAAVLNAVLDAYFRESVNKEQKQRLTRLKDLKDVCEQSEEKLRRQRQKLEDLARLLKAGDRETAGLRQKIALEEYAALRNELIKVGAELRAALRGNGEGDARGVGPDPTLSPEADVETALDNHPDVLAQAKKVSHAVEALNHLKKITRPGFKGLADAEADVNTAREEMTALRDRLRPELEARARRRKEAAESLLAAKHGEREAQLKAQFASLQKEVEELRKTADQVGLAAVQLEAEKSEIDQAEKVVHSLWEERERLEVEGRSSTRRVTLEVEAVPPRTKNRKAQYLAVGGAGLGFFWAGVLGVGYWDVRSRRIYSRQEVVHGLGLRVLGSLPVRVDPPPAGRPGGARKYAFWNQVWTESLSGVRTVLLHEASRRPLRVVLVTSACPLEGKTTLAKHLAGSIAGAGRRALVIDADTRRPTLHRLLGAEASPGLTDLLRGEADLAAVVRPTSEAGLWLIPAGAFDESVPRLLAQDKFQALLDVLRSQFDFIVIDSSPLVPVNDALLIGRHVDAAVLSVRPRFSRMPLVREACDRLRALNIPVLGAVLNGLQPAPENLYYQQTYSPR